MEGCSASEALLLSFPPALEMTFEARSKIAGRAGGSFHAYEDINCGAVAVYSLCIHFPPVQCVTDRKCAGLQDSWARAPALRRLTTDSGTSSGRPPRKMNPVRITQKTLSGGDKPPFGRATIQKRIAARKCGPPPRSKVKLEANTAAPTPEFEQAVGEIKELLTIPAKAALLAKVAFFLRCQAALQLRIEGSLAELFD